MEEVVRNHLVISILNASKVGTNDGSKAKTRVIDL